MTMIINNIFDQFIPIVTLLIPVTLINSFIVIAWIVFTSQTHWLTNRGDSLSLMILSVISFLSPSNTQNSWFPWLISLFFICLSFNLLSLIPYTFSHTSHLSITFSLSLPIWLAVTASGFRLNWKAKLSHLLPLGTPLLLIPLMVIIEFLSLLIQPVTLGFRLGANLLAGHLLIFLCSCATWEALNTNLPLGFISITLLIVLLLLEFAVSFIQATVFFILSKNYLEDNDF
uniref:ATP synthase subunit a n=1 Tax=Ophiomusa kimblae TaxID=3135533 RepID=A0AAU6PX34_9ECHI